jgi:hypothetical protein
MALKFDTKPVKVDQFGHQQGGGQFVQNEINQANIQQSNRVTSHGVSGRLSNSGGRAAVAAFLATPEFEDVDVATDTIGTTKATLDASLALVNDGLAAVIADANSVLSALGIPGAVYAGGGTAASPIAAIGDSGTALATSATAANMNPIREQMDTNMHVAGALVNKVMRSLRARPLDIETNPMRQPPPDNYGQGSIGFNPPDGGVGPEVSPEEPTKSTAGSGAAFGNHAPYTDPTPAVTEDSGTHAASGVTKTVMDEAFSNWSANIESMATRLSVATFNVAALTDNSGGAVEASGIIGLVQPGSGATVDDGGPTGFVNVAATGSDLATEADFEASQVEVRNAIEELADKARELAAGLGVGDAVYDGTGVGSDGTIAVIDVSITGATTGIQAAETNTWSVEVDQAFDMVTVLTNRCAAEVDITQLTRAVFAPGVTSSNSEDGNPVNADVPPVNPTDGFLDPYPGGAIPVDAGTAADPGVLATVADTALVQCADNVATIADKLNEVRSALQNPLVKLI